MNTKVMLDQGNLILQDAVYLATPEEHKMLSAGLTNEGRYTVGPFTRVEVTNWPINRAPHFFTRVKK